MHTPHADASDELISEIIENLFVEGGAAHAYSLPIPQLEIPGICNFYAAHLAIWQIREQDLQKMFPLTTPQQRSRYLAWCVIHGQHEYQALRDLKPFWNELARPAAISSTEWSGGVSRLLQLAILGRPDLSIDPALRNSRAQEDALAWFYLQGGFAELGQSNQGTPSWQRAFFLGSENILHSRFVDLLYRNRSDISNSFHRETEEGAKNFNRWLITHATVETGLSILTKTVKRAWPNHITPEPPQHFGVNLIGYAYGELGIGEDVRMAAHALYAADIPFTIINITPGPNVRQNDRSVEKWVSEHPRYIFNIICLTALEHLRVYLKLGESLFIGRYNIAYWPWELHFWPKKWQHCFNLADEIWASSKHIERAAKLAGTIPVRYMPMSVAPHSTTTNKENIRKKFKLPNSKTLFVFSFDGNSHIKRKNPLGIIEAFTKAFPLGSENVCLIIKCMRPDKNNTEWGQILELAARDKRLIILDITLTKEEVMELYQSCDCFVSLHRAEGFGRGIAEAIILQLDVIATSYGGNVEFCETARARLIPYKLVPVDTGDYIEAQDNYWAEPDLHSAAEAMRAVYFKKNKTQGTRELLSRSKELDLIFSPNVIGARYGSYLRRIFNLLEPSL